MSSPSPVTDGKHVWVMTGVGMLKAFDFAGKELWSRDIQTDYGRFGLNWGYASSPLLHDDALYVQVLHGMKTDDPSVRAEDRRRVAARRCGRSSGRPTRARSRRTRTRRRRCSRYGGKTEIVITGGDVVTGHDPATGKELWRADILNPQNNRQLPHRRVAAHRRRHRSSRRAATTRSPRIRPGGSGDVSTTHVAWTFAARPGRADAGQRRHLPLRRRRQRRRLLPRPRRPAQSSTDRSGCRPDTYSASPVARRRQDLRDDGEHRGHDGVQAGPEVRDPRVELPRRRLHALLPQLGRGLAGTAVPQDQLAHVGRRDDGGSRSEGQTVTRRTRRATKRSHSIRRARQQALQANGSAS